MTRSFSGWWVSATLLLLSVTVMTAQTGYFPEKMIVTASVLKLRSAADVSKSNVIETLPRGTVLEVKGLHNKGEVVEVADKYAPWYQVVSPSGKMGYAFGAFLTGTYSLHFEDEMMDGELPPVLWYGVYRRDSFSDEVRKIEVSVKREYSEMYGEDVALLKTNQKDTSKFIIGSVEMMKEGYAGPLGITDSPGWFFEGGLMPGSMLPISSGQVPGDTLYGDTYFLAATGCATLKDNYMQISNFKMEVFEMLPDASRNQDMTEWFVCEPGLNPSVQLLWYGDIDQDRLPDAVIHDCPLEMGCRTSLFLSSKAKKGALLQKVCEHFWDGD